MNKEELLQELTNKIRNGDISREEVVERINAPKATGAIQVSTTNMLYILGAVAVVIGIVIFVGQIWKDIGSPGKIAVTFGLGLLFTLVGSILLKKNPKEYVGSVFHTIGGLLIPGGAIVTLRELHVYQDSLWPTFLRLQNQTNQNAS